MFIQNYTIMCMMLFRSRAYRHMILMGGSNFSRLTVEKSQWGQFSFAMSFLKSFFFCGVHIKMLVCKVNFYGTVKLQCTDFGTEHNTIGAQANFFLFNFTWDNIISWTFLHSSFSQGWHLSAFALCLSTACDSSVDSVFAHLDINAYAYAVRLQIKEQSLCHFSPLKYLYYKL